MTTDLRTAMLRAYIAALRAQRPLPGLSMPATPAQAGTEQLRAPK